MKKKLLLTLFVLPCVVINVIAQTNLIPNASFETNSACPTTTGQISNATSWASANTATPDYFNSCANAGTGVSVPANNTGTQNGHAASNAYAGFFAYDGTQPEYREYLQSMLTSPLAAGVTYCFSMYVSLSDSSQYSVDKIGVHFSNTAVSASDNSVIAVTPQVSNPAGTFITDNTGWTRISAEYTAVGGEQFITIGNFKTDSNTPLLSVVDGGTRNSSFYYIDDLNLDTLLTASVTESTGGATNCPGTSVTLTSTTNAANPTYLWSNGLTTPNITVELSTTTTFTVTISNGICDNVSAPVTVYISTAIPTVTATKDTSLCALNDTTTLKASGGGFSGYWWSTFTNTTDTILTTTGAKAVGATAHIAPPTGAPSRTYMVHCTDGFGCPKTNTILILDARPIIDLGNDTITFPFGGDTLDAGSGYASYLWTPGGATTQTRIVTTPGDYSVVVTDSAGCQGTDAVHILVAAGIDELYNNNNVRLYPNPADGFATLSITSQVLNNANLTFVLYDVIGREVTKMTNIKSTEVKVNFDNIEKGLYSYKVFSTENIIATGKVILK